MAAGDGTFYNLKWLHRAFAASAALLLLVTLWMIAADHYRPWRAWQRTYRDEIQPWHAAAAWAELQGDLGDQPSVAPADAARLRSLAAAIEAQPAPWARRLWGLPFLDAFGRPLAIEQIWLPELSLDYHFRQVPRTDRCTTCHQAIDRQAADGSSAFPVRHRLRLSIQPPAAATGDGDIEARLGWNLVAGPVPPRLPTVQSTRRGGAAAVAGLLRGDALSQINGQPTTDAGSARRQLADALASKTIELEVVRGLAQPLATHPRPELFVAAGSPHPMGEFGCTICHQGQGSATDFSFASHAPNEPAQSAAWRRDHGWTSNPHWDQPMRPRRLAESGCLQCHHQVTDLVPSRRWADPPAPRLVEGYTLVRQLGCFGCHEIGGHDAAGRRVGPDLRLETLTGKGGPGTERKVGPNLVDAGRRLGADFIADFVADPRRFRPAARMPRLFGLLDHLDEPVRRQTDRREQAEVAAIAAYLAASQAGPAPSPPASAANAARGRASFQQHGCLACHQHRQFDGRATVAADLTGLGSKYTTPAAAAWLASWIRDPAVHSPRTRMPSPQFDLEPSAGQRGRGEGAASGRTPTADPAADIAVFLLQPGEWRPLPPARPTNAEIDAVALEYLEAAFPPPIAKEILAGNAPAAAASRQADAGLLSAPISGEKKLAYVARRALRKRGCVGCHQVEGINDAALIGPALTGWGRKDRSLLGFEAVAEHVAQEPSPPTAAGADDAACRAFFREAVTEGRREGFVWQKLRAPRSFDYRRADDKPFHQHLQMGLFGLTDAQREAIVTFVLGLTGQAPTERYLHRPSAAGQAMAEGRQVIDDLACAECHTIELDRWAVEYRPGQMPPPAAAPDFPIALPKLRADDLARSRRTDRRGLARADVVGMPRVDAAGRLAEAEDDEGEPAWVFSLWEPAAIDGAAWRVGGADVLVSPRQVVRRWAAVGGAFARLLYPLSNTAASQAGSVPAGMEAWGWGPPPLVHQGRAVRPEWLHAWLQRPHVVRPAAGLRMPRYNLSATEATKLVNYFAAAAGVENPQHIETEPPRPWTARRQARLDQAMRLITDRKTYCAKCHVIGDFAPEGEKRFVLAPDLAAAGVRLRPDYLRRWLANPKSVLPYTPMPVNFPPVGPPQGQDLLPGTSDEQLDAVVDLLLNYREYVGRQVSIRRLAEEPKRP